MWTPNKQLDLFKDNSSTLRYVHENNKVIRDKVILQEAVELIEQTLSEYVENSLSDVRDASEYKEDISAINNAWEQIKTKVEEVGNE